MFIVRLVEDLMMIKQLQCVHTRSYKCLVRSCESWNINFLSLWANRSLNISSVAESPWVFKASLLSKSFHFSRKLFLCRTEVDFCFQHSTYIIHTRRQNLLRFSMWFNSMFFASQVLTITFPSKLFVMLFFFPSSFLRSPLLCEVIYLSRWVASKLAYMWERKRI